MIPYISPSLSLQAINDQILLILEFEEIFTKKIHRERGTAKRLGRDIEAVIGTIYLPKILNFECSSNSYLFFIRKLKAEMSKTLMMIEALRTLNCMPQKMILCLRENQRFRGKTGDWRQMPGELTTWSSATRTEDKCPCGGPYSIYLCSDISSLLLLFSKLPEKGVVAHLSTTHVCLVTVFREGAGNTISLWF